jgi:hypothetical protein
MRRCFACIAAVAFTCAAAGCGDSRSASTGKSGSTAPKSVLAGGVRLGTEVPPLVARACRDAQREVSIRVVCPGFVPEGPLLKTPGLWGGFGFDPHLWLITFNNGDNGPRYLHWIMGAGSRASVEHFLLSDAVNDVKGLPRKTGEKTLGSRTLLTYRYPPHPAGGPNGGHTAVYVSCGDEFVFASLHGRRRAATEKLALALADKSGCS